MIAIIRKTFFFITFLLGITFSNSSFGVSDAARETSRKLYSLLTGTLLLDGNPLKEKIENFVESGNFEEAVKLIQHPRNGAAQYYNNTIKNFALPINRNHSVDAPVTDLTALFIGVTRDDGTIDELMHGKMYYEDGIVSNSANPNQQPYTNIFPFQLNNNLTEIEHYTFMERRGSLRDELVKRSIGTEVGVFTTHGFGESYYNAGTNRRAWKGVVEHFFCSELTQTKTIYIPDTYVHRDVPRQSNGTTSLFQNDCKGCHAQMDGIKPAFGNLEWTANRTVQIAFKDKINETTNFPQGYLPPDNSFTVFVTDAQDSVFGFRDVAADTNGPAIKFNSVAEGLRAAKSSGLRNFARIVAASKGYSNCLAKRIVTQLVLKKVYSLPAMTEADRAALDAEKELIAQVAAELDKSRSLSRGFGLAAIELARRQ